MLFLEIPEALYFDDLTLTFTTYKKETLQLEHSLVSVSKWESIWRKSFLSTDQKTIEEMIDYVRCMTITQNVNPDVYTRITPQLLEKVNAYILDEPVATWFTEAQGAPKSREVITSEIIYYWMIALTIPFDPCQKWHLNRLIALIRVCSIKNQPPKKMNKKDALAKRSALNQARRAKGHTKG